ncbi:MAG: hypothetical protein B5M56_02305 [Desulfococcus sp. 4484_241]|nr:MAG: hypothetical protein B5M56_02305 [Desulfococcus sp. 4484_241]
MKQFLAESDKQRIIETVKKVEQSTSGEIVPMVVPASYHYPTAAMIGGAALGIPTALLFTRLLGALFWLGTNNIWIFLGAECVAFVIWHAIVNRVPWLKRLFVSAREMADEVDEAAFVHFYKHGLHKTREQTGILIFISVFERKVVMLADSGINEKVAGGQWDEIVAGLVSGIKAGRQVDAICNAVEKTGAILARFFPVRPDDTDELENLIVEP